MYQVLQRFAEFKGLRLDTTSDDVISCFYSFGIFLELYSLPRFKGDGLWILDDPLSNPPHNQFIISNVSISLDL